MGTKAKRQPGDRTAYWSRELPICCELLRQQTKIGMNINEGDRFGETLPTPIIPTLEVKYQIADISMMHLQAKNMPYDAYGYIWNGDKRGTRLQYAIAVDADGKRLGELRWESNLKAKYFDTFLKDIFNTVAPDQVKEIYWVTVHHWYDEPDPNRVDAINPDLGTTIKEIEIEVIIFRRPRNKSFAEIIDRAEQQKKKCEEAYLRFPTKMPRYRGIERALREGCRMHGFSSGGGLRVIRLEKITKPAKPIKGIIGYSKLIAYGEHPHVEDTLKHLNEDYFAGGRPYKKVYGKKHPHYLTGDRFSSSNIDYWLRSGNSFDCWFENGEVYFQLSGYGVTSAPKDVVDKVRETGTSIQWHDRGYTYETTAVAFANGEIGCSSAVIETPADRPNNDPWMYHIQKTGHGQNFWEAMIAAFAAPEIEIIK